MIRMLTALEGEGISVSAGQTTDKLSKEEEARYIAAGLAELVSASVKKQAKKPKAK